MVHHIGQLMMNFAALPQDQRGSRPFTAHHETWIYRVKRMTLSSGNLGTRFSDTHLRSVAGGDEYVISPSPSLLIAASTTHIRDDLNQKGIAVLWNNGQLAQRRQSVRITDRSTRNEAYAGQLSKHMTRIGLAQVRPAK